MDSVLRFFAENIVLQAVVNAIPIIGLAILAYRQRNAVFAFFRDTFTKGLKFAFQMIAMRAYRAGYRQSNDPVMVVISLSQHWFNVVLGFAGMAVAIAGATINIFAPKGVPPVLSPDQYGTVMYVLLYFFFVMLLMNMWRLTTYSRAVESGRTKAQRLSRLKRR